MMNENIIMDIDSYKASHAVQYPPKTTSMFSYFEARKRSRYPNIVFFGLQYIIKRYLTQQVTYYMVKEAEEFFQLHGEPFPFKEWMHVVEHHDGHLPVRIRAVPEGTIVPKDNVLFTVESTDPAVFWIVNWLETMLVRVWGPMTVATRSYYIKRGINDRLVQTADDPETEIMFKLHDFGSRGVTSRESAEIQGAGHLVNFIGSDNVGSVRLMNHYYGAGMAGFSIPAAEHSTITSWGRIHELDAFRNMITQFGGKYPLFATVSDSYDLWQAIDSYWGRELKQEIIDSGSTLVVRPDSGDPPTVVAKCLAKLDFAFGHTLNTKGYKVLNNVRVIQGDGCTEDSVVKIMDMAVGLGYSMTNLAFGMGGGLLQKLDRDDLDVAFKCSSVVVDGQYREVWKDPLTDPGKASKRGRLDLVEDGFGNLITQQLRWDMESFIGSKMQTVFENGELLIDQNLDEIRARVLATSHDLSRPKEVTR